jgi:Rieske 2Fe-2S family protein
VHVLPEFAGGYAAQYYVGHGAEFGPGIEGFTVDGSAGVTTIASIAEEHDRRYFAVTIKPQVFLNLVPDHVILHPMYPLAADRTIVDCGWLHACERCQPGMSSRAYAKGGVLVPSEHHIGDFHDWVRNRLGVR